MDVTFSKQWIHLRRSERWPPTSTILKRNKLKLSTPQYKFVVTDNCQNTHTCHSSISFQSLYLRHKRFNRDHIWVVVVVCFLKAAYSTRWSAEMPQVSRHSFSMCLMPIFFAEGLGDVTPLMHACTTPRHHCNHRGGYVM